MPDSLHFTYNAFPGFAYTLRSTTLWRLSRLTNGRIEKDDKKAAKGSKALTRRIQRDRVRASDALSGGDRRKFDQKVWG